MQCSHKLICATQTIVYLHDVLQVLPNSSSTALLTVIQAHQLPDVAASSALFPIPKANVILYKGTELLCSTHCRRIKPSRSSGATKHQKRNLKQQRL